MNKLSVYVTSYNKFTYTNIAFKLVTMCLIVYADKQFFLEQAMNSNARLHPSSVKIQLVYIVAYLISTGFPHLYTFQ